MDRVPSVLVPPRSLFSGLIDDAALFPPRNASVPSALAAHLTWQTTPHRDLVGPLLCPATRVEELAEALPVDDRVSVAILLDGDGELLAEALAVVDDDPRLVLVGVEAAHVKVADEAAAIGAVVARRPGVTGSLEVDRYHVEDSLPLIGPGCWQQVKYRTGGMSPDAFPTEGELAAFIIACTTSGLPFKLTAGLHHVVRNYDQRNGFQQHGVLNVLVAADAALAGEPLDVVAALLAQRGADVVVPRMAHWDAARVAEVRSAFRSFGCCDPGEPVAELRTLGLLQEWPS